MQKKLGFLSFGLLACVLSSSAFAGIFTTELTDVEIDLADVVTMAAIIVGALATMIPVRKAIKTINRS